jgi:hypothetical protein
MGGMGGGGADWLLGEKTGSTGMCEFYRRGYSPDDDGQLAAAA